MKKLVAKVILISMVLSMMSAGTWADSTVRVMVNGEQLTGPSPVIVNSRTMVPLRAIFEKLNWHVSWDDWTKTATVKAGSLKADLALNSHYAVIDGEQNPLDVPVTLINGSVMLPVSFFSTVGVSVNWDGITRTVQVEAEPINWDIETIEYTNGDVYVGETFNGEPDGKGTFNFANGAVYQGNFAEGYLAGYGKLRYADGGIYDGNWWLSARNGKGILRMVGGAVYDGEWKNGQKLGTGTLTYENGDRYVGDFKNDSMNGYGTMTFVNGGSYVGNFVNDKYHGYGVRNYADGTKYDGMWSMGAKVNGSTSEAQPTFKVGDIVSTGIFTFKGQVRQVSGTKALVYWYGYSGDPARFYEMKSMWNVAYEEQQWMDMKDLTITLDEAFGFQ